MTPPAARRWVQLLLITFSNIYDSAEVAITFLKEVGQKLSEAGLTILLKCKNILSIINSISIFAKYSPL